MLPRRAIRPDGHWRVGIAAHKSHGLQCGPLVFVGGQVDLDENAQMQNAGDLGKQASNSIAHMKTVLAAVGADAGDLVQMNVFYVSDGGID